MDMRYGSAPAHERVLDFRSGTLRRTTEWTSPTGRRVRIHSERLVSFTSRAVAAIRYEVEPLDGDIELVLQSDLLANEHIPARTDDPRVAAALESPLVSDFAAAHDFKAVLAHHTRLRDCGWPRGWTTRSTTPPTGGAVSRPRRIWPGSPSPSTSRRANA